MVAQAVMAAVRSSKITLMRSRSLIQFAAHELFGSWGGRTALIVKEHFSLSESRGLFLSKMNHIHHN
jgi:hypothetical protein